MFFDDVSVVLKYLLEHRRALGFVFSTQPKRLGDRAISLRANSFETIAVWQPQTSDLALHRILQFFH